MINNELFLSILAMDSYNRGYGQNLSKLNVIVGQTFLGNARIIAHDTSAAAKSVGFYAIAYNWTHNTVPGDNNSAITETIISYRGTNFETNGGLNSPLFKDIMNGWTAGAGFSSASQVGLAVSFYEAVATTLNASDPGVNLFPLVGNRYPRPPITLTGHSLGGGLAGFVASHSSNVAKLLSLKRGQRNFELGTEREGYRSDSIRSVHSMVAVALCVVLASCGPMRSRASDVVPEAEQLKIIEPVTMRTLPWNGKIIEHKSGRFQLYKETKFCGLGFDVNTEAQALGVRPATLRPDTIPEVTNEIGIDYYLNKQTSQTREYPLGAQCLNDGTNIVVRGITTTNDNGGQYKMILMAWQGDAFWQGAFQRDAEDRAKWPFPPYQRYIKLEYISIYDGDRLSKRLGEVLLEDLK